LRIHRFVIFILLFNFFFFLIVVTSETNGSILYGLISKGNLITIDTCVFNNCKVDKTNGYGGAIYVINDLNMVSEVLLLNCNITGGHPLSVSALNGGFIWLDGVCYYYIDFLFLKEIIDLCII
jgi:hypothetical protein